MFDPDFDFVHPPEELDDDSTWKGIPEYADELLTLEDNLSDKDSEAGNSEIDDVNILHDNTGTKYSNFTRGFNVYVCKSTNFNPYKYNQR